MGTTTLNCKRCNGNVFIDTMFVSSNNTELYCLQCGQRWKVPNSNPLIQWIEGEGPYQKHGCRKCGKRWLMKHTDKNVRHRHYEDSTVFACNDCGHGWSLSKNHGVVKWLRSQEKSDTSS